MLVRVADLLTRRAYWMALLAACVAGFAATAGGWSVPLENWLDQRVSSLSRKAASGEIIIVEIDAKSLAEVQAWPWPRSIHGRLVDRLREAGARRIVFDVDFTSPASDPAQDRAFGAAIARADGRVVLPAILENSSGEFGERVEALPAPLLRNNARIGSIWIRLDNDMVARRLPYSVEIAGARRPSLAAHLSGAPSDRADFFPIDWSIDRASFPTISYSDVLNGRFAPEFFRNRNVLIGATSTTFGDRFTVPVHGRIPGVLIQATGAETLRIGSPRPIGSGPAAIIVWIAVAIALRCRTSSYRLIAMAAVGAATVGVPALIEGRTLLVIETAPAILVFLTAGLIAAATHAAAAVTSRLTRDAGTLLPNLTAMTLTTPRAASTVAVRVRNYLDTAALLGPQAQADLLRKISDRLSLAAGDTPVFQVDEHSFAWRTTRSLDETIETMEGLSALFGGGIAAGDRTVDVTIGIGICADEQLEVKTAVAAALLAADRAVQRGISWGRYEPDDDDEKWRISLLADLGHAIQAGDIWVAYQPQCDLRTGKIMGAEALARWTHPTQGELRPERFIPILEEDERIYKLTMHVLRTAILDFSSLDDSLSLSVNISMRLIGRRSLAAPIRAMLDEFRLAPSRLTLEITESAPVLDPSHLDELRELREMGIRISIDDFGTGQSTLSYLKTLPATELKIDRSFVQLIVSSRSDATMVDSTIKLAHALGLTVVAEGVESKDVYDKLVKMECDVVQGYYLSRPLAFDDFEIYYERRLRSEDARRARALARSASS